MKRGVQHFFDDWVKARLPHRMLSTPQLPGPLAMFDLLCADAAEDGISEDDLRDLLVDPFEAMIRAMMDVAPPRPAYREADDGAAAPAGATPVAAMRLAIHYLDGFREVVRGDNDLAANLILFNLAQQGFQLTAWSGVDGGPQRSSPGHRNRGLPVPTPEDLLEDRFR